MINVQNICKGFIEKLIIEVKKPENMNTVNENILDPIIMFLQNKLLPYTYCVLTIIIILLLVTIINFVLILKMYFKL